MGVATVRVNHVVHRGHLVAVVGVLGDTERSGCQLHIIEMNIFTTAVIDQHDGQIITIIGGILAQGVSIQVQGGPDKGIVGRIKVCIIHLANDLAAGIEPCLPAGTVTG